MKQETIDMIRNSGFKIKYLAGVIGVHKNTLSMAINQDGRKITPEQEEKLQKFLNAVPNTQTA